jgi:hypothetical protein
MVIGFLQHDVSVKETDGFDASRGKWEIQDGLKPF